MPQRYGEIHASQRAADQERDTALAPKGFTILRFANQEIENQLQSVLNKILTTCNQIRDSQPCSPPLEGEGPGERSQGAKA